MTPEDLEAPVGATAAESASAIAATAPEEAARSAVRVASTDALLSIEQAAILLGESPGETRDLTSMGLLKHQLIDGERCVRLGDLIAYKRDFDRDYAEYLADPLNQAPDDSPNPFDVLPEYAQMLEP